MHRPKRPDDLAREAAGVPPQPLGSVATTIGTVKYWREEKGYGVIASDATAPWDIWCHFMHIVDMPGFRSLEPANVSMSSTCGWIRRAFGLLPHASVGSIPQCLSDGVNGLRY